MYFNERKTNHSKSNQIRQQSDPEGQIINTDLYIDQFISYNIIIRLNRNYFGAVTPFINIHSLLGFPILSHFWNLFTGSLFNLASFSNSALLPIKLFLLENLHIFCSCFLYHPSPDTTIHLVFTCCLFPGLKLRLGLVFFFQLLSLLSGIHSLNMLSHQIT